MYFSILMDILNITAQTSSSLKIGFSIGNTTMGSLEKVNCYRLIVGV